MSDSLEETLFGRILVENKLVSPQELRDVAAEWKELSTGPEKVRIGDLLVQKGYITKNQLRRIRNQMDDSMSRPAQQIPGFQILDKLGSGAMAQV